MLFSGTSGIPCLEQSSSNLACIPLLPLEAILSHECQSEQIDALISRFRVENTDSQTYVDPNIDSILSAETDIGVFFHWHTFPELNGPFP